MNLVEIATGWWYYLKASKETRQLMRKRLAVCDTCPNKVQVSETGEQVATLFNQPENTFKCKLCHCPLGSLSSVPTPACKAGKWDKL